MKTEDIKQIVLHRFKPELLGQAAAAGISESSIFTPQLLHVMTELPSLLFEEFWQLSALNKKKIPEDWSLTDNCGNSPIHYVAWSGNLKAVLAGRAVDPEQLMRVNDAKMGVIHFAALSGSDNVLASVLDSTNEGQAYLFQGNQEDALYQKNGKFYNLYNQKLVQKDDKGRTAAHFLAWSGVSGNEFGNVGLQIINRYDADAWSRKDHEGRTMLHYAAWSGVSEMFSHVAGRIFGPGGSSHIPWLTEQKDAMGRTASDYAALSGNINFVLYEATYQSVLEINLWLSVLASEPEALNPKGLALSDEAKQSALRHAILSGNPDMIKLALPQLAKIPPVEAMSLAVASENIKMVELLIVHYADKIDAPGKPVWMASRAMHSVMHTAAKSGNLAMLQTVLGCFPDAGDALTRKDDKGNEALVYAADSTNPAMLEWVLGNYLDWVKQHVRDPVLMAAKSGNAQFLNEMLAGKKLDKFTLKNSSLLDRWQVRRIYETVLKTLETNFALQQVEFPRDLEKVPAEIREGIERGLARNRLLWEPINELIDFDHFTPKPTMTATDLLSTNPAKTMLRIAAPFIFFAATVEFSKKEIDALQDYYAKSYEKAQKLKVDVYGVCCDPTKTSQFFQDHLALTRSLFARRIDIRKDLVDSPRAILEKFNERAPRDVKVFAKNVEKDLFGAVLIKLDKKELDSNWLAIKKFLTDYIEAKKIKPSVELQQLLKYLEYRVVVGIEAQAYRAPIATISDDHRMDHGASGL